MMKTLREWVSCLDPQAWVKLGADRMKAYEVLSRHTYLDGHGCVALNLDTYNYRVKYNDSNGIWSIKIYG